MRVIVDELIETFRRALRLAFFRRVQPGEAGPGLSTLLTLLALFLALTAGFNVLEGAENFGFNEWGIVTSLSSVGLFAAVLALTSLRFPRTVLRRALADDMAINCLYVILATGIYAAARQFADQLSSSLPFTRHVWIGLGLAALAWMFVSVGHAGRHLWDNPVRWGGARVLAAFILPILLIPSQPIVYGEQTGWRTYDVWYWSRTAVTALRDAPVDEPPLAYEPPHYDVEDTLFRQQALLNGTLGAILPSEGDKPQFFFLAAAPSAAQDVFAHEVVSAKEIFDARFGTRGHSAVLITSRDTLETVPLATNRNIEEALREIGDVMNRERDVLVLFITSHGAEGFVSVSLPGYPLNQITPDSLAAALDNAHIKNRVLIISACHSGSFIPRLAGPNSLVMTAARADRTSLGCGNGRAWTYFGDALFNHALREETDLIKAFAKADDLIKQWEFWRRLLLQKPSEPQISVGAEIAVLLQQIEVARQHQQAAVSR